MAGACSMLCLIIITIFSTYLSLSSFTRLSSHFSPLYSLDSPGEISKVGQERPTRLAVCCLAQIYKREIRQDFLKELQTYDSCSSTSGCFPHFRLWR